MSLFNVGIEKHNQAVAEILIEIIQEDPELETELEEINNSEKTNKGYNDTRKYKHFAQAYKKIAPPKDFEDPRLTKRQTEIFEINKASKNTADSKLKNEELTSFESVNSILNKRSNASQSSKSNESVNKNSSIIYSLRGRTDTHLPIPIYLCDAQGKIVVNITVNANGKVVNTSINAAASTSSNTCLQEHAIDYAKESQFDSASKASQIGTITFYFKGK